MDTPAPASTPEPAAAAASPVNLPPAAATESVATPEAVARAGDIAVEPKAEGATDLRADFRADPRAEADAAAVAAAPSRLAALKVVLAARMAAAVAGVQRPAVAAVAGTALATGALGLALGAVSASRFAAPPAPAAPATVAAKVAAPAVASPDIKALNGAIAQLRAEVAALKTASEQNSRSAAGHFAKLGERVERVEKGQADPAGRLAKLNDAADKLDQRLQRMNAAPDVTGSFPPTAAAASAAPQAGAPVAAVPLPKPAAGRSEAGQMAGQIPAIVDGWRVRSVYDGAALLQGRNGVIEVQPGDNVPGAGRVQTIRRVDGRWVVVTSRGTILSLN